MWHRPAMGTSGETGGQRGPRRRSVFVVQMEEEADLEAITFGETIARTADQKRLNGTS